MIRLAILLISFNIVFAISLESVVDYTIDVDKIDVKKGEELYIKKFKCHGCHGVKGERSSGTFPRLDNQSASSLKSSLRKYKDDRNYGGRTRFAMQRYSNKLSHDDIDNIVAYLKNADVLSDKNPNKEPSKKTKNNLYLE